MMMRLLNCIALCSLLTLIVVPSAFVNAWTAPVPKRNNNNNKSTKKGGVGSTPIVQQSATIVGDDGSSAIGSYYTQSSHSPGKRRYSTTYTSTGNPTLFGFYLPPIWWKDPNAVDEE
jgi:hypothetical protein